MGIPLNVWLIRENPIKMDELGVPPFMEPPIYCSKSDVEFHMSPTSMVLLPVASSNHFMVEVLLMSETCGIVHQT